MELRIWDLVNFNIMEDDSKIFFYLNFVRVFVLLFLIVEFIFYKMLYFKWCIEVIMWYNIIM